MSTARAAAQAAAQAAVSIRPRRRAPTAQEYEVRIRTVKEGLNSVNNLPPSHPIILEPVVGFCKKQLQMGVDESDETELEDFSDEDETDDAPGLEVDASPATLASSMAAEKVARFSTRTLIPTKFFSPRCAWQKKAAKTGPYQSQDPKCLECKQTTTLPGPRAHCEQRMYGETALICDGCGNEAHQSCLEMTDENIPEGDWFCRICSAEKGTIVDDDILFANEVRTFKKRDSGPVDDGFMLTHVCAYKKVTEYAEEIIIKKIESKNRLWSCNESCETTLGHPWNAFLKLRGEIRDAADIIDKARNSPGDSVPVEPLTSKYVILGGRSYGLYNYSQEWKEIDMDPVSFKKLKTFHVHSAHSTFDKVKF